MTWSGSYPPHNNKRNKEMIDLGAVKDKALYTTKETADILGVTTRSVHNYAINGKLKKIKNGYSRLIYYRGRDIKNFAKTKTSTEDTMVTEIPDINDTDLFSVNQTAELLGVAPRSIETWLRKGHIKCVRRKHNGYRFFTGKEIKRFYTAKR